MATRRIGGGIGIVDDERDALHGIVEVLLLSEPVIAQVIAVVGGKDDQRIFPAAQSLELGKDLPR
jgi:hypothetical protein